MTTIDQRFNSRHNSVNALRLGLALLVLVSHTLKLHGGADPLAARTKGDVDMGTVAVDGFFALSGFLIAGSFLNSPSVWRYLWRRCLRILPGLWVCLLITAFVLLPIAQLLQYGTMSGFPLTGDLSVVGYVIHNADLFQQQFFVRNLLDGLAVNGSLYTLFYEFVCYLGIAVLGVLGLLRRNRWVVLAAAVALWAASLADLLTNGGLTGGSTTLTIFLRFGTMFFAGTVLRLWADRIPLNWAGGAIAVTLLAVGLTAAMAQGVDPAGRLSYVLIATPAVAYLVLLLGSSTRLSRLGATRDLSYGVYVYAWPVQVLLLLVGASGWPVVVYFAASLGITLLFALASWHFVESPALSLKSWTPRRLVRDAASRTAADH